MEYNRIVAVTGMPGLYEVLSSKTDGAIVRSLEDGSTKFIASRVHNLTHLESIEVYTTAENVQLAEVLKAMKDGGGAQPDVKDNKALKTYFEKTYPALDFEKVYASDMKKMVKWFEVLEANNIDFTIKAEEEEELVAEEITEEAEEKAPAKKASLKKAAPKKSEAEIENEGPAKKTGASHEAAAEEKKAPAKKAAAKKSAAEEETPAKKTTKKKS
ncbi:MAG: DUF5606 domain-containing protein [Bacteroidota bacterium]